MNINTDELRSYLIDYYGSAAQGDFPAAYGDLFDVENASPRQLVQMAENTGVDLTQFATASDVDFDEE